MVFLPIIERPTAVPVRTRFAPSPNGALHLGHAFSALCARDFAHSHGGQFLLRIEDIDGTRSRPEHITAILADLDWLSLIPDEPVSYQSRNMERYQRALDELKALGLLYRCTCTRSDILAALKQTPVSHGPDGPHYPGTCRNRRIDPAKPFCWRIDMAKALVMTGPIQWTDMVAGTHFADPLQFGDVVLWRKDAPASYHLAATVDDAADGISHVVRGLDLFAYTAIHRVLQQLLDLPVPQYWHHRLLVDDSGQKLAKSKSSPPLSARRVAGEDGRLLIDNLHQGVLPLGISLSSA
ncbi:tRNA glutamyl-Q(34) synthetase GluQRS [Sphingorhabdus lacus]|jgi:glutamyl-Q tRNA(Asp) synthetase|uniref:tRNA glutamyl-Q(34) synthetase GluQRS n=1 Tax=Sphingorhabdus lacus TaxID=392610 RepID=A0A6I6LD50_9SPHN|nr:tRNA glutamyl-Q(34) synthetase GluQRS [Sphingorhabdus lacus]QGY81916.1 tRNA glutamyl-Q(34) synthetase GluQRS [Sphingorhabdus lacus]